MRLLLLCVFLLPCLPLPAQDSEISVEPAAVVKEIVMDNLDEGFEDITTISVTNNSRRSMQLVQTARGIRQPGAWTNRITGRGSRKTPYSDRGSGGKPVVLAPGETGTFQVALRPDGITGAGRLLISFSELTAPGRVLGTASIATKIIQRPTLAVEDVITHSDRPTPNTVRLYPNPAKERFFVEGPNHVRIGRVEISNTLGRKLRSFDRPAGEEGYDIEDLPDGLYLITVFDASGKQIKTLRMLHRQFGA